MNRSCFDLPIRPFVFVWCFFSLMMATAGWYGTGVVFAADQDTVAASTPLKDAEPPVMSEDAPQAATPEKTVDQAADKPEDKKDQPPAEKKADEDPGAWLGDYGRWIKHAEHLAMTELDLWGSSSTMPEGFLVLAGGYGTMRAAQRFDKNRKLIDIIPVFKVPDAFNLRDGRPFFTFNFNARGETKGYFMAVMYGINDRLMVGANTLLADISIRMDPILIPGTCERLGIATLEEFYRLLEELGRPRPKTSYKSSPIDMGDTAITLSWNYYRNQYFSGGMTPRVIFPTAHQAQPDKAIIFALGPDLDTGAAAWGVGFNPVFDFRPPEPAKFVSLSLGLDGAIFAQSKRPSPKFYKPNQDVLDYLKAQKVELDFFPDLSDMDPYYYYTPPPWVALTAGIGIGPVGLTYRHGWGFQGSYETNSPGFKKVIKTIGLVGTGDDGRLIASASVPLTPLYLPGVAQFRFEYVTDGKNAMVFRDIYQVGAGFLIPLAPPEKYRLPKKTDAPAQ